MWTTPGRLIASRKKTPQYFHIRRFLRTRSVPSRPLSYSLSLPQTWSFEIAPSQTLLQRLHSTDRGSLQNRFLSNVTSLGRLFAFRENTFQFPYASLPDPPLPPIFMTPLQFSPSHTLEFEFAMSVGLLLEILEA